jgi:glycosidase
MKTLARLAAGGLALGILVFSASAAPAAEAGSTNGSVFYEIFVRSFQDSNGDGVGDLPGLLSRLDELNDGRPETTTDLGVDGIWLMPVFKSPSYHGYDTTDYETINPDYGTNEDFTRLCEAAHRRGMKVIIDLVVNHTGAGHPWFVDSASSPSSPRRDWYVWKGSDPGWRQPWGGNNPTWHPSRYGYYYGVFWSGMPDLNLRNPDVRREMERIAELWLSRGADGYRLDAARHAVEDGPGQAQVDTPETHAFWKEFAEHLRRVRSDVILVGENWSETPVIASYYRDLPMNFDFPLAEAIVRGVDAGDGAGIAAKLAEVQAVYPPGAVDAPFLTNHDQIRAATKLGNSPAKLKNAAAILLTLPGTPFLYYGEEIGLQNGPGGDDKEKRTPMPWSATSGGGFTTGRPWHSFAPGRDAANLALQKNDPSSLDSRYRSLIRARKSSGALSGGTLEILPLPAGKSPVLAFVRKSAGETVLVLHNLSDAKASAGPYSGLGAPGERLFCDAGVTVEVDGAGIAASLAPRATAIVRLGPRRN